MFQLSIFFLWIHLASLLQANKKDMPTNLTMACFLPNPDADETFRKKQHIEQGDAWIIPRDEIGDKVWLFLSSSPPVILILTG